MSEYVSAPDMLKKSVDPGTPLRKIDSTGSFSGLLTAAAVIAFFCGYMLLPLLASLLMPADSAFTGIVASSGPVISLIVLFSITRYRSGSFRKTLLICGFRRFPRRTLLLGIFIAGAITLTGGSVTMLWEYIANFIGCDLDMPPTVILALSDNILDVIALLIVALLAAPFFEEIFFRKVLYGVSRKFLPSVWAAFLASFCFSALHISLLQLPGLLLIGWIWQSLYLQSKNLWTSVILHFFNNLIAAGLLLAGRFAGITETLT